MGLLKLLLISVPVLLVAYIVHRQLRQPKVHSIPEWKNFGRLLDTEALKAEKLPPEAFKVKVTGEEIADYQRRLREARFPTTFDKEVNMTYGYPSHALPQLRDHMLKFDHNKWADMLNRYNHYRVTIFGLKIHFIKVSGNPKLTSVPLLLIHGWPGSFYEFYKAIPVLQAKAAQLGFTYDIVIPSFPGYGFSEAPVKSGCSPRYAAAIFNELMTHLGYDRYLSQGGDWGSFVTEWLVGLYPQRLIGFHVNMFSVDSADPKVMFSLLAAKMFPSLLMSGDELLLAEAKGMFGGLTWLLHEGGYLHIQGTKPNTLGPSLTDSPLGLAVYILEKFYTWTDGDNVDKSIDAATADLPYTVDDVLNNIMIYWHTNSIQSSVRFYKEAFLDLDISFEWTDVPGGVLFTRHEITFSPKFIANFRVSNLVQYTALNKGGHFAAFEIPDEFSTDVVSFTNELLRNKATLEQSP